MELDTVDRVVLRMAVIDVHRATADTTNHLTVATRTNALVQTVTVQQVPLAQPIMAQSAVHAILVIVW